MRIFTNLKAVTPHDTNIQAFDAFMVGADGTVNITTSRDQDITVTCVAGHIYPIAVKRIRTGGTATGILGMI